MNKRLFFLLLVQLITKVFLSEENVIELKPSINKVFSLTEKLYYYVNLAPYKDQQEGIISLKVDKREDIKFFNGRYVTNLKLEEFKANMPLVESEFDFISTGISNYFHLYFRRNDAKELPILLVYVEFTSAKSGSIVASSQEKIAKVYSPSQTNKFEVKNYVPYILKYAFDKEVDFGFYLMFFCDQENYQRIYNGHLLPSSSTTKSINKDTFFSQLYAFTIPETSDFKDKFVVTMVYFGPQLFILSSVKNTFSKIKYFGGEKPKDEMFYFELINAMEPFYIFASYTTQAKHLIYFEKLYGDFIMYSRDRFDGDSVESILPGLNNELKNQYVASSSTIDIFSARCTTPCGFNIHFFTDFEDISIKAGESKMIYLEKNNIRKVSIKETDNIQLLMKNIHKIKDITIKELNADDFRDFGFFSNQTYSMNEIEEENILLFNSSQPAIIQLIAKSKHTFRNCSDQEINTELSVLPIINNSKTFEYDMIIENLKPKPIPITLHYSIYYGPLSNLYEPKIKIKNLKTANIKFINPYLQDYPESTLSFIESVYYLVFRVEGDTDPELSFFFTEKQINELNPINPKEIEPIEKSTQFDLQYEGKKQLVFFTNKCSNIDVKVRLRYFHQTFKVFYIQKQFSMVNFTNPFNKTSVYFDSKNNSEPFAGLRFYYDYLSNDEMAMFSFDNDFRIQVAGIDQEPKNETDKNNTQSKNSKVSLSWTSPMYSRVRFNLTYLIYQYNIPQQGDIYDICRNLSTFTLAANFSSNKMDENYEIDINRDKDNYIFIVAQPQYFVHPQFFYNTITIPSKYIQPDKKTLLWLYVSIGVLGAICIGLSIGYFLVLKKRKTNVDMSKMPDNEPLVND